MKNLLPNEDEQNILKMYFKTAPIELIRLKAQAVIMKSSGLSVQMISKLLFRSTRSIYEWLENYQKYRSASLFSGKEDNENASKLTRAQKAEIKEALKKPPDEYGLPKEFWDIPQLRQYVEARFGTVYESDVSYYFLLEFCNLSFKYPAKFDVKRDDNIVKKKLKRIRKEITPFLKNDNWEVFASDETRIELEAITRKAWLQKGKKTVMKVQRKKEYQNYIGFLNQKTYKCNLYSLDWQNQENILKVIKEFLNEYPKKRICIIWDNARFHKGKLIQEALKKGNLMERVHLINFPPYAPDTNPIEHLWGVTKQNISNKQYQNFDVTKTEFENYINSRKFEFKI